jgi:aconitate hydratase
MEAINSAPVPREITVTAESRSFQAVVRIGTPGEAGYRWHGGIMREVLRSLG